MANLSDDELLAEFGIEVEAKKITSYTAQQERIIAGFEDILRFVQEHQRIPQHGESRDIFERLYAMRLDVLRRLPEAKTLLVDMDKDGLLTSDATLNLADVEALDDETLLAELGLDVGQGQSDITVLKHVATRRERQLIDAMANRTVCKDFETFEPLFKTIEHDLKMGKRKAQRFGFSDDSTMTAVDLGDFFILGGQLVYVAHIGEVFKAPNGESDARLRVIYSNGTESNLLRRSLQRALYKDDAGRRVEIVPDDDGPLFSQDWEEEDIESGTIYVLRSLSDHPYIAQHRELIHKIGVTGGNVQTRIANAKHDATYLLADVEVVATYKLANINRIKLESIFHRIFASAQIDLTLEDRFGKLVHPQEWFLVPLHVIDEAVECIRNGSITSMVYDPGNARLLMCKN